jgi:hypothetical protein
MHAIMNAEHHKQEEAHDYGGRRVKAMEPIKQVQRSWGLAWRGIG